MESHFPFKKLSPLENMQSNIVVEGKESVWKSIEDIKNPISRCKERRLFTEALKKLEK